MKINMEEPFTECLQCKHLLTTVDSMKHTLKRLEQSLEQKQQRLNIFILDGIMTEVIHHQLRIIELERLTTNKLMIDLASKYSAYSDQLINDHDDDDDED